MKHTPNFEVPTQRFGEVTPHDIVYNSEQLRIQEIVDAIGVGAARQVVELPEANPPAVESAVTYGQYL